jgi:hypothetical protein
MASEQKSLRRGLTAHDRALVRGLIDAEARRRQADEAGRRAALKLANQERIAARAAAR